MKSMGSHHVSIVLLAFHFSLFIFLIDVRHELVKLGVLPDGVEVLLLDRHLIVVLAIVKSHLDFYLLGLFSKPQ